MVILPNCVCCCPINPIGTTSESSSILLSEIHVTVSTSPPGESGAGGPNCGASPALCSTNPNTHRAVFGIRNAVPSSGQYVLTKTVETISFATYAYSSESFEMQALVYKKSYICATWSPGSKWTEVELTISRAGSRVFFTQGNCFGVQCFELPTQAFLASLEPKDPSNYFTVVKERVDATSSYRVVPSQFNVAGVTVLGRPATLFDPVSTVSGPQSVINCVANAPGHGITPSQYNYTVGPMSSSLYAFDVTAIDCVYTGGLPNRSAFVDS